MQKYRINVSFKQNEKPIETLSIMSRNIEKRSNRLIYKSTFKRFFAETRFLDPNSNKLFKLFLSTMLYV